VVPLVVAAVAVLALAGAGLFTLGRGDGGAGPLLGGGGSGNGAKGDDTVAPVRLTVTPRNRATRVALDAKARVVA
jgi:hypothetical protein